MILKISLYLIFAILLFNCNRNSANVSNKRYKTRSLIIDKGRRIVTDSFIYNNEKLIRSYCFDTSTNRINQIIHHTYIGKEIQIDSVFKLYSNIQYLSVVNKYYNTDFGQIQINIYKNEKKYMYFFMEDSGNDFSLDIDDDYKFDLYRTERNGHFLKTNHCNNYNNLNETVVMTDSISNRVVALEMQLGQNQIRFDTLHFDENNILSFKKSTFRKGKNSIYKEIQYHYFAQLEDTFSLKPHKNVLLSQDSIFIIYDEKNGLIQSQIDYFKNEVHVSKYRRYQDNGTQRIEETITEKGEMKTQWIVHYNRGYIQE